MKRFGGNVDSCLLDDLVLCYLEGKQHSVTMNPEAEKGSQELLKLLSDQELYSLFQTVTGKKITVGSRKEAQEAVVAFTLDPAELLTRRKISKDLLIKYCYQKNIKVTPKAEKNSLVNAVLEHWGCAAADNSVQNLERLNQSEIEERVHSERTSGTVAIHYSVDQVSSAATVPQASHSTSTDFQMAVAFGEWFYKMLNGNHPALRTPESAQWGPSHFFPDCRLKLLVWGGNTQREIFDGSDLVTQRLLAFITEELLLFNPNLEQGGVQARSQQHGLCQILVCGTVHQHSTPVGVFEQHFGLVRDPNMANNWRIKFTNLKLQVGAPSETPTLNSSAMFAITSH